MGVWPRVFPAPSMKSSRLPRFAVPALVLVVMAVVYFARRTTEPSASGGKTDASALGAAAARTVANETKAPDASEDTDPGLPRIPAYLHAPDPRVEKGIAEALEALRKSRSPEEARMILARLKQTILSAREPEAASAVVKFLRNGQDAPSGLPFSVGPDGVMELSPTLRVMLMDVLATIDPLASVDVARQTISARQSQDEYAMALRNLGWNDFQGDMKKELTDAFIRMLDQSEWLAKPSAGFLEAFDIPVQTGGTKLFDELTGLIRLETTTGQPVANGVDRAAFMALDRMVLRDPSLLVGKMNESTGFLEHSPEHRAALMSRLDITEPSQRDAFIRYMEKGDLGEKELDYFSKLFPNGNFIVGNRLVSADEPTPSIGQRLEMDRKTLEILNEIEPSLKTPAAAKAADVIRKRLEGFIAQADKKEDSSETAKDQP